MATVQDRLTERKAAIAADKAARADEFLAAYFDLVRRTADDAETDPSETIDTLFNADKTEDNLHHDVGIFRQRRELYRTWQQLGKREKDLVKVEQQLAEKRAEFQRVAGKLQGELTALEGSLVECRRLVGCSRGSERELVNCAWPHTLAKEAVVRQQLKDLHPGRLGLEDAIRGANATLQNAERLAKQEGQPASAKQHNGEVAAFQRKEIARYEKQLAELEKQRLALDKQLTAVAEEKLQP